MKTSIEIIDRKIGAHRKRLAENQKRYKAAVRELLDGLSEHDGDLCRLHKESVMDSAFSEVCAEAAVLKALRHLRAEILAV